MNNEIKEILEDYKKISGEITEKLDNTAEYENWLIIQDYFDKLLDYITNLQEENERLEKSKSILIKDRKVATDLFVKYKQRIDKAIKIIEKETKNMPLNGCKQRLNNLSNILKGEDKE